MPALIDLRKRIKSVRNTQQITQAMKTVSTAKFKKLQRTLLESRPYWHTFSDLLSDIAAWTDGYLHPLLHEREEEKVECLVITSDKGLCGAFNSNLLEKTLTFLKNKSHSAEVRLILAGKKAASFFKRHPFPVDRTYTGKIDKLTFEDMSEIASFLMEIYAFQKVDAVYVAYNEFRSIISPRITISRLLPVIPEKKEEQQIYLPPDWEPEVLPVLNTLLPLYIEDQVCHYFNESSSAEQAARMIAMDNATKNAEELIEDLTLILNKIRQASITKELLEIITAVDALEKR